MAALVVSAATILSAGATYAYRDGAPPGFSGGFGEDSCWACHFDGEINEAPGTLTLGGVPASYTPGESYALTIALGRPGMRLAGFQLTARFEDGRQAGALAPSRDDDARVTITPGADTPVLYAHQRGAGAEPSAQETVRWTVLWTAPPSATSAVLFHVAANAADGDESASGDYVYTAAAASLPR